MYPETEQITAERMCYIVNDKDLSQQAKEYFAQIRKTDRLIHRLDSTIATLRSSLTSTGSQLKQDKVQTSGPKNTLEETITKIIVHPRCVNFITEISNYTWAEDKFGAKINVPIDDFNHLMDAMRYGLEDMLVGPAFSFD